MTGATTVKTSVSRSRSGIRAGWAAAVLVAGCSVAPRPAPPPAPGALATPPAPRAGTALLHIVPAESEIRVRVYRAGPLASLGHNHIISWSPTGWVSQAQVLADSAFGVSVELDSARVDDARERATEGPDFPGEIPAEARAGTARNMLGEELLDAAHHPRMLIRSTRITAAGSPEAQVLLSLAGRYVPLRVPFTLRQSTAGEVRAEGTLDIRQSELGLKPFSVMLGALQVQDRIQIRFRFVARREAG